MGRSNIESSFHKVKLCCLLSKDASCNHRSLPKMEATRPLKIESGSKLIQVGGPKVCSNNVKSARARRNWHIQLVDDMVSRPKQDSHTTEPFPGTISHRFLPIFTVQVMREVEIRAVLKGRCSFTVSKIRHECILGQSPRLFAFVSLVLLMS
jgi:hypothetical protein